MMRKTIKANFVNGNLVPLEPCALDDGDEVLVQVRVANGTAPKPNSAQPDLADKSGEVNVQPSENEDSSAKGHPILEMVERIKANMPEHLQPEDVPTDAAKNYKHYLYGWPKESD